MKLKIPLISSSISSVITSEKEKKKERKKTNEPVKLINFSINKYCGYNLFYTNIVVTLENVVILVVCVVVTYFSQDWQINNFNSSVVRSRQLPDLGSLPVAYHVAYQ